MSFTVPLAWIAVKIWRSLNWSPNSIDTPPTMPGTERTAGTAPTLGWPMASSEKDEWYGMTWKSFPVGKPDVASAR